MYNLRLAIISVFAFTCFFIYSCAQEYSFEGAPVEDPVSTIDSSVFNNVIVPTCMNCDLDTTQYTWSFNINVTEQCGKITDAVLIPDKTAFTFFGPSSCSRDTGLIIEAYFAQPFTTDKYNYTARSASIQYYDNIKPSDVFTSWSIKGFQLVIDSFNLMSRKAKDRFSGYVITDKCDTAVVRKGWFSLLFR